MKRKILISLGIVFLLSFAIAEILTTKIDRQIEENALKTENKNKLSDLGINNWTYIDYDINEDYSKRCLIPDKRFSNYSLGCSENIDVRNLTTEEKLIKLNEWEKDWMNKVGEIERKRDIKIEPIIVREGKVTIKK